MTASSGPALVVTAHGGIDVLTVEDRPTPETRPGEVLVEVAAAGVNFIDVYQREGIYPTTPPFVAGNEGAGTVVSAGAGGRGLVQPGDRVAWPQTLGSAARFAALPASALVPVPEGVDLEIGGRRHAPGPDRALPHHEHVCRRSRVTSRSCTPPPAGWASCSCRWCGRGAARSSRRPVGRRSATTARGLGAEHVIDYRAVDDLAGEVRRLTDGRGVDVAYDGVGKDTFDASLASLRPRGTLALFGAASGQVPPVRPPAAQLRWFAVRDPADAGPPPRDPRGARVAGRGGARRRGRRVACTWRSVAATRSPRPRRRTPTSRAGAPRASCSSSPDPNPDLVRLAHGSRPRMPCENRAQVARGRGWGGSVEAGQRGAGPEDGDGDVEQGERAGGVDELRAGPLALALLGRGDLGAGHDGDRDDAA